MRMIKAVDKDDGTEDTFKGYPSKKQKIFLTSVTSFSNLRVVLFINMIVGDTNIRDLEWKQLILLDLS